MKYIVLECDGGTPILFPDHMDHAKIANNRKVQSAGFCRFVPSLSRAPHVYCYWESISLGINSNGVKDALLIERLINNE